MMNSNKYQLDNGGVTHCPISEYYRGARWEFGYASLCRMSLPPDLEGMTVVDIGCRRGKGVFKLSERVGADGHVIGIDWVPGHIAEANERMDRAWRKTGLPQNNMEFHLGFPEDLSPLGLDDDSVDAVFVNSILHLTYRPDAVLSEMHRILKPGGMLICNIALASAPRDAAVVDEARRIGNSIQAAPFCDDFENKLASLGFEVSVVEQPTFVEPSMGFKEGHSVPTAPSDEQVEFQALVLLARKNDKCMKASRLATYL